MTRLLSSMLFLLVFVTALFAQNPLPSRVVDEKGKPVAFARIDFKPLVVKPPATEVVTVSDGDGYYGPVAPPGKYAVKISAFGFKTLTDTMEIKPGTNPALTTTLHADPADNLYNYSVKADSFWRSKKESGELYGKITDAKGVPIFAEILVRNEDSVIAGTATGRYGFYTLNDLKPGSYYAKIASLAYVSSWSVITIIPGQSTILNDALATDTSFFAQGNPKMKLLAAPGDVLVKVTDADGQPVPSARFVLKQYIGPPEPSKDETDKNGVDTLKYAGGDGGWYLFISKKGYNSSYTTGVDISSHAGTVLEKSLTPGTPTLQGQGTVTADCDDDMPPGMIRVTVKDMLGNGIPSINVSVQQQGSTILQKSTNRHGSVNIKPLPRGVYQVVTDYGTIDLTVTR